MFNKSTNPNGLIDIGYFGIPFTGIIREINQR